ncbi:Homeobox-like_domain superfamily [Hexamita inflata]|uniref:Homeobox-like domain superfamily n=1 Tax=Hexamita inflata TaxID=28002 RepID=A0AA86U8E9_9EUKA|nr:Homeobox-like domain superfamily [Hexamita inflata]
MNKYPVIVDSDSVPYMVGNFDMQDIVRLISAVNENILFTGNMKHIQWEAVQKRMQLPLKECKRVWKYVSHQIKTNQPIFTQNEANLSQFQEEPSDLNRSDLLVAQSDAPQVQNSQVLLQSSEEKLLQLALSFHGPEWDYIQRKYLPMRTLKQLKQSYQLMRKNALVKLNQVDRKEPHDRIAFKTEAQELFGLKGSPLLNEKSIVEMSYQVNMGGVVK